ncbi:hemerythrin HHE cation-binding protein [Parafrankia colletiae]|uniref:Hemerythrin HHE cation-binding protein n=1 Tax=Parafrankia colletiae TaxID=573497 RepID=A0A1S1Q2W5_9ACTN|nr:hemerythrin domain-containing protein [Parafrankia colletiae]MCK9904542.1 hemerythrin domain-containing protein [Frankia sp. Cpl3]OHV27841.1 hemerythrin HHE cation-binding protein [Parafrankia colletiae]
MTVSASEKIDFTMMYVTHDAFRRDLARFIAAAEADRCETPGVRAGWENFRTQLLLHHTVEDNALWPQLREAVADRPTDLALVEEMEAEHAELDPLLAAVDAALTDKASAARPGDLAERVAAVLGHHLQHEEKAALPLIQSALTPAHWKAFSGQMRRRQGVKGTATYVPWILDGASPERRRDFLAVMPPPVRILHRVSWERRYRQREFWIS